MIVRPASVTHATRVSLALVLLGGISALLTWVFRDDLLVAWAQSNNAARTILEEGGLEAVEETLTVPSFVPVAITSWVVLAMLVGVLVAFFVEGFNWARLGLAAIAVFGVFLAVLCMTSGIPTLFVVLGAVMVVLCVLLLFFLFHKDTNAYIREV